MGGDKLLKMVLGQSKHQICCLAVEISAIHDLYYKFPAIM